MTDKLYQLMDWPRIEAVVYAEENQPREILGPHPVKGGILVQCFFPDSKSVTLYNKETKKNHIMNRVDEAGYYAVLLRGKTIPKYEYKVVREDKTEFVCQDAYAYPGRISLKEEKAFCAGVAYDIYRKLGAHPVTVGGVRGIYFAVWAPNAQRVSVVGDFNQWDGRVYPMHRLGESGIYELFIPQLKAGILYKYEMRLRGGVIQLKYDPYANGFETQPGNASMVPAVKKYAWEDQTWLTSHQVKSQDKPLCIYEIDLTQETSYEQMTNEIIPFVKEMGYTHIEISPAMEWHEEKSFGYDTIGYYAPTRRLGTIEEFKKFIDGLHQENIGIIMDWTPAHFPKEEEGMARMDGTCLYEMEDPRRGIHPMWGTLLYNYGSPQVKNFLIANAMYWVEEFHMDGFRMDDVDAMLYLDYGKTDGQWLPNIYGGNENLEAIEFLKHLNSIMEKKHPGVILIAQEDGLWPELTGSVDDTHMGFDYKWSGGWTQDFIDYLHVDAANRPYSYEKLTLSMFYAYSENFILTMGKRDVGKDLDLFMEGLPGEKDEKVSLMKAAFGYLMTHPGKKMMALNTVHHPVLTDYLGALVRLYQEHPALYENDVNPDGFEWIQHMEAEKSVLSFLRKGGEEQLLILLNFSENDYDKYSIGVPFAGKYKEIFNSDRKEYGGNGFVNPRVKASKAKVWDDRENSIVVKVPKLSISVYTCVKQ